MRALRNFAPIRFVFHQLFRGWLSGAIDDRESTIRGFDEYFNPLVQFLMETDQISLSIGEMIALGLSSAAKQEQYCDDCAVADKPGERWRFFSHLII